MGADVAFDWLASVLQRVRIAVEFVDGLHPLLVLLMAWFLHAHRRTAYPSQRYANLASQVASISFFLYLAVHHIANDMDDVWTVATYFGRGVLIFQIMLAVFALFQTEIQTPFRVLTAIQSFFFGRLPHLIVSTITWAWSLLPDPPPPPPEPVLTRAERRRQEMRESRDAYRDKLHLTRESKLPRTEQQRIRNHLRRQYLKQIERMFDD